MAGGEDLAVEGVANDEEARARNGQMTRHVVAREPSLREKAQGLARLQQIRRDVYQLERPGAKGDGRTGDFFRAGLRHAAVAAVIRRHESFGMLKSEAPDLAGQKLAPVG